MNRASKVHHTQGRRSLHRASLAIAALAVLVVAAAACTSSKKSNSNASGGSAAATFKFAVRDAGGPLTVKGLQDGSIQIGEFFSVDPTPSQNGWVTLIDDKHLQAADNFVPAIRTAKVTPQITTVLDDVSGKLTQTDMQQLVGQVKAGSKNQTVADKWLQTRGVPGSAKATGSIKVGSASFTESGVAAYLYGEALKMAGVSVSYSNPLASRQVYWPALTQGQFDLIPEFTNSLLVFLVKNPTAGTDLQSIYNEAKAAAAQQGVTLLQPSNVTDVNAFVVTKQTANKYNLKNLSDLAKVSTPLALGGPPECQQNKQCIPGLERVYGLRFQAS